MTLRDWLALAGFSVMVGSIFYNIVKTNSIKTNDFFHLGIDVKTLLTGQKEMKDKLGKHAERISTLEGKISN